MRVHTAVENAKRIHKLKQNSVNQNYILNNYQQLNQIKNNLKRGSKYIIKYLLHKKLDKGHELLNGIHRKESVRLIKRALNKTKRHAAISASFVRWTCGRNSHR
jgi:hypothetical protein